MKTFLKTKKVKSVLELKTTMKEQDWEDLQSYFGLNWEVTAESVLECMSYEHLNKMNRMTYTEKMIFLFKSKVEQKKQEGTLKPCVQWLEGCLNA